MTRIRQNPPVVVWIVYLSICLCLCLILTACGDDSSTKLQSDMSANDTARTSSSTSSENAAFDINSLDFSSIELSESGYSPFDKVEDFNHSGIIFPMELVNKVGRALYTNKVPDLISQLDDRSLRISMSDFTISRRTQQFDGSKLENEEKWLYEALDRGVQKYIVFKFDGDGDGADEIYMFEDLLYSNAGIMNLYVLEPNESGAYQYSIGTYFDSRKYIAAFQFSGEFFFLFNHENFATNTTLSLELARVVKKKNDYRSANSILAHAFESVYMNIDNKSENAKYTQVYVNGNSDLTENVKKYVKNIEDDLMQSNSRTYGVFFGYEQPVQNQYDYFLSLYSSDSNNDGKNEMFSRAFLGQEDYLKVAWFKRLPKDSDDKDAKTTPPFKLQAPNGYDLRQMWFIPFDGKTVTFRLFQKYGDLRFVLDACLYENSSERHIAVYKIQYLPIISFEPYWESVGPEIISGQQLNNPDHDKAFGMLSDEKYPELVKQYSAKTEKVKFGSKNFPEKLVSLIEDSLLTNSLDRACSALHHGIKVLSLEEFVSDTSAYFEEDRIDYFESCRYFDAYCSDFDRDGEKEYIVFSGDGSGGFGDFDIFKLKNGKMEDISERDFLVRDFNSFINFDGNFYFVLETHDYNTKVTEGVTLFRLFPDGHDVELYINIQNKDYKAYPIYKSNADAAEQISRYIEEIDYSKLLYGAGNKGFSEFLGDESKNLNTYENSKLYSIGGEKAYYKIDYNNDGTSEYFTKYFRYPSVFYQSMYLVTEFFELNNSVTRFSPDFGDVGTSHQLWYKVIDGKTYTFRVLSLGTEYVINSFLLEGNSMRQMCTYILFPQSVLNVYEEDTPEFRG